MTRKDLKEAKTILMMADFIEQEFKRVFTAQEYQIEALQEENKRLRDSLEKVESDAN